MRAALDGVFAAVATYGEDYPTLLREVWPIRESRWSFRMNYRGGIISSRCRPLIPVGRGTAPEALRCSACRGTALEAAGGGFWGSGPPPAHLPTGSRGRTRSRATMAPWDCRGVCLRAGRRGPGAGPPAGGRSAAALALGAAGTLLGTRFRSTTGALVESGRVRAVGEGRGEDTERSRVGRRPWLGLAGAVHRPHARPPVHRPLAGPGSRTHREPRAMWCCQDALAREEISPPRSGPARRSASSTAGRRPPTWSAPWPHGPRARRPERAEAGPCGPTRGHMTDGMRVVRHRSPSGLRHLSGPRRHGKNGSAEATGYSAAASGAVSSLLAAGSAEAGTV